MCVCLCLSVCELVPLTSSTSLYVQGDEEGNREDEDRDKIDDDEKTLNGRRERERWSFFTFSNQFPS